MFLSSEKFAKEEILKGKRDVSWIWVLFKLEILKLKSIYEAAVGKGVREQVGWEGIKLKSRDNNII